MSTTTEAIPTEPIKRTVRVTIEKEIEVEIMPSMWGDMTVEQYLAEFRKGLWEVDGIDDLFKYAARCAFDDRGTARDEEGLGLVGPYNCQADHELNVKYQVILEDCTEDLL